MGGCSTIAGGSSAVNELLPCNAVGAYIDPAFAQQLAAACGTAPPSGIPAPQADPELIEEEESDDDDTNSSGPSTLRQQLTTHDLTPSRRSSVSSDNSRKRRMIAKHSNTFRPSIRLSGGDIGWMDLPQLSLGGQETFHFPPPSRAYSGPAGESPNVDAYFRRRITPSSTPFKGFRALPVTSPTDTLDAAKDDIPQASPSLPLLSPLPTEEEPDFFNGNPRKKIAVMGCTGLQGEPHDEHCFKSYTEGSFQAEASSNSLSKTAHSISSARLVDLKVLEHANGKVGVSTSATPMPTISSPCSMPLPIVGVCLPSLIGPNNTMEGTQSNAWLRISQKERTSPTLPKRETSSSWCIARQNACLAPVAFANQSSKSPNTSVRSRFPSRLFTSHSTIKISSIDVSSRKSRIFSR